MHSGKIDHAVIVTNHAKKRIKHRVCKNYQKTAENAWENGVSISNVKGRLRRHLDKYYLNNEEKNGHITKFKLYNNHVFLFSKNVLVTVITLPGRLLQLVHQTIKKEHTR